MFLTFSENRGGGGGWVNPKLKKFNFLVFFYEGFSKGAHREHCHSAGALNNSSCFIY